MRAAVIEEMGSAPVVRDLAEPGRSAGRALVEVTAAPLNPIDLSIASGRFYRRPSELPYVAGKEAVGRVVEADRAPAGARVYLQMPGGLGGPGALCERVVAGEDAMITVPDGVDDTLAACLGIAGLAAWVPLERRAGLRRGERVLVLGASGAVGQIAVQAARLLGAGRVVAAARSPEGRKRALELGAHAAVDLGEQGSPEQIADRVREAAEGGVDVTLDPLWDGPAAIALHAAAEGGRIVHVGQSAGGEATLPSAPLRGKSVAILGHAGASVPREVVTEAYRRMARHAAAAELTVDHEVLPLDRVAEAWKRQAALPRGKLVLRP